MLNNHHIDRAIGLVESYQWAVDDLEEAILWAEDDSTDEDFLAYCREELEHCLQKLERKKVLLDICIRTFNKGGWSF